MTNRIGIISNDAQLRSETSVRLKLETKNHAYVTNEIYVKNGDLQNMTVKNSRYNDCNIQTSNRDCKVNKAAVPLQKQRPNRTMNSDCKDKNDKINDQTALPTTITIKRIIIFQ